MSLNPSRTALITGASRGLGKETALTLAAQGNNIIFTYKSNKQEAQTTLHALLELGVKAIAIQSDCTIQEEREMLLVSVKETLQHWEQTSLHFLINNAGTNCHALLGHVQEEQLDDMYSMHVKTVLFMSQLFSDILADNGSIVNIGSGTTRFAIPQLIAYATMKGAVETLTKYLAKSLASRQITVNAVAPGALETSFNDEVFTPQSKMREYIASVTSFGRVGEVTDVAGVIAFLCSDESNWITGQRIEVSGGIFV